MRTTAILFCLGIFFAACADTPGENATTTQETADVVAEEEQEPEEWSENPMDFIPEC